MTSNAARTRIYGAEWLAARGISPDHHMLGCAAGAIILAATPLPLPRTPDTDARTIEARNRLWTAAQHMRRCYAAYAGTQGIPRRHAQVVRILAPTERMEASGDDPAPDLRTEGEKAGSAEVGWWNVRGQMRTHLTSAQRHAVEATVIDDVEAGSREIVIMALWQIAEWLDGRVRNAPKTRAGVA